MATSCHKRGGLYRFALVLSIIGGINWGLVGLGGFLDRNLNVVNLAFGSMPEVEWVIYLLVGLSAFVLMTGCRCTTCVRPATPPPAQEM